MNDVVRVAGAFDEAERALPFHVFRQAPIAIAVLRWPELRFEFVNAMALGLLGKTEESQVLGQPLFDLVPEAFGQGLELPDSIPGLVALSSVLSTGEPFQAEECRCPVDRGSGVIEDVYLNVMIQPNRDHSGVVTSLTCALVDVTEQVLSRRRVESMVHELQRADQHKDQFLATLAHELRNPMAALSTALALLERVEGDAAKTAKYRETARRQMQNLVRLVDDMLDVSRIAHGKIELRKGQVDVDAVLQGAVAAVSSLNRELGHEIRLTIAPGSFRVEADPTRVEQIIVNLLGNAARYTPPGGCISVSLSREDADAGYVVFRVRDTGRGIPAEMLEHVFQPFTQVSPRTDKLTGGLGLGLALVKKLVELHGGTVTAQSDGAGRGSEFVVRLPRGAPSPTWRPPSMPPPSFRRRRIVVVEDADDVREMLSDFLERLGHEVYVADDGLEGVAHLVSLRPDIGFVDVGLPCLDGYEVARRVRARATDDAPFLVALTGYGGPEVTGRAKEAGFDVHLTKPIDMKVLSDMLIRAGTR